MLQDTAPELIRYAHLVRSTAPLARVGAPGVIGFITEPHTSEVSKFSFFPSALLLRKQGVECEIALSMEGIVALRVTE